VSLSESVLDRTDTKAHIAPEDLVLAAMHLLPSEEVEAARSHLKACLPCRQELARVCVDLAALAFTSREEKPSLASRERLLAQVALEKKIVAPPVLAAPKPVVAAPAPAVAAPTPAVAAPRPVGAAPKPSVVAPSSASPEPALRPFADFGRGRGTTLLAEPDEIPSRRPALERWIGWATAAVFAVVSVILYTNHRTLNENLANQAAETQRLNARAAQSHQLLDALTDPQAIRAMLAPKALLRTVQGPRGDITYNPEKGALIFLVGNLDPLQVYKTYQLWLLPAAGRAPIPAGTFHPDEHGNASVIMPKIPSGIDTKRFEVTIEDAGGTDKPSGPIVLTTS